MVTRCTRNSRARSAALFRPEPRPSRISAFCSGVSFGSRLPSGLAPLPPLSPPACARGPWRARTRQRSRASASACARLGRRCRRARLASITLPMRLGVVAPVADHRVTAAPGTAHALRPAKLAPRREALRRRPPGERLTKSDAGMIEGSLHEGGNRSAAPIIQSEVPGPTTTRSRPSTPRKPTRASMKG